MSPVYSESAMKVAHEIYRTLYKHGLEAAMEQLEVILDNPTELTAADVQDLHQWHQNWSKALDPHYRPPHISFEREVFPLLLRHYHCTLEPGERLKLLWAYVQHCHFGTIAFQDALEALVTYAVLIQEMDMARHAASMLLHHYAMLNIARSNPLTPVGKGEPSETHQWLDGVTDLCLPCWAAIEALENDPSQCWVDILEIQAEITPMEGRKEYFYPHVLAALRQHYWRKGELGRLEWLKAYEPD